MFISAIENYPAIKKFALEENEELLNELSYGSNIKLEWQCAKNHSWLRSIKNQIKYNSCKICKRSNNSNNAALTRAKKFGLLEETHPELIEEWSSKNEKSLNLITSASTYKAFWECKKCSYEWQRIVVQRTKGKGKCPRCAGEILIKGENDLETLYPLLTRDWSEANVFLPSEVKINQGLLIKWQCHICSHEWESSVKSRTLGNTGCIKCYRKTKISKGQRELYEFIHSIDSSSELNAVCSNDSKLEVDIYVASKNIAFEYNGDYWHSESVIRAKTGETGESRHQRKLAKCLEAGVTLYYIWESEWRDEPSEVKEKIKKILTCDESENIFNQFSSGLIRATLRGSMGTGAAWRTRELTLAEKILVKERYLSGEPYTVIAKDLGLSKYKTKNFIDSENLVEARLASGISKNGASWPTLEVIKSIQSLAEKTSLQKSLKEHQISYKSYRKALNYFSLN